MGTLSGPIFAIGLLLIGIVMVTVAVATPYWTVVEHNDDSVVQGLFEICYKGLCVRLDSIENLKIPDSLILCRGTNIVGLILGGLAALMSFRWFLIARMSSDKDNTLPTLTMCVTFLAAALIVTTLVVYGVELFHPAEEVARLGFSIYINAIGAFLLIVGGVSFKVASNRYLTSLPDLPPESCHPRSGSLTFFTIQQPEVMHRGLVFQQPKMALLQPPPPYTPSYGKEGADYVDNLNRDTEETHQSLLVDRLDPDNENSQEYVAHLDRNLKEGQYTPGESRKPAPGSSSI